MGGDRFDGKWCCSTHGGVKLAKAQSRARAAAEHLSAIHDASPELQAEAAKALAAVRDLERAAARRLQSAMLR